MSVREQRKRKVLTTQTEESIVNTYVRGEIQHFKKGGLGVRCVLCKKNSKTNLFRKQINTCHSCWAANNHPRPTMQALVVFPVPFLFSTRKPLIGTVVLYLQVYHCPYPFGFANLQRLMF